MQTTMRDKVLSALGSALVIGLLGYALLIGLNVEMPGGGALPLTLLDLRTPPPPVRRINKPPIERPQRTRASGRPSPRNLRNKAAQIAILPPLTPPVIPPTVVATPVAGAGMAAATGASDRTGSGEGAGGRGDGEGGDGRGDSEGDGSAPRLRKGRLKYTDLPPALRDSGVSGTVSVHYNVGTGGTVSGCRVTASSGSAELDRLTCQLIEERFRYDPSRDREGRPVPSTIDEDHRWDIDRQRPLPPH